MDILNQIIQLMDGNEVRYYKLFAKRTRADFDRKDIKLFDYIRKHGDKEHGKMIFPFLYKTENKNAFYRLRKHLMNEVNKSIILQHFEEDSIMLILYFLTQSRYYLIKKEYKIVHYFLKQAEKQASAIGNYELLDVIYGQFLKLSADSLLVNPEPYFIKSKESREKLNYLKNIDSVLAVVNFRLKTSQNYIKRDDSILSLLQTTIHDFSGNQVIRKDKVFKLKIFEAVSQVLLQKRDYLLLEKYLIKTWKEFIKEKVFDKNNHNTKLQLLTYIVNTLFKNKKYNQSLLFAEELKAAMKEHNELLYDKYLFYYYNSLVINYSEINPAKALEALKEFSETKVFKTDPYSQIFVYINFAVLYFDKAEYKKSIRNLTQLFLLDSYKTMDTVFHLKLAIAELIIRFELSDIDIFEKRWSHIVKDYNSLITQPSYRRESEFIKLLYRMNKSRIDPKKKNAKGDIEKFLNLKYKQEADSEIINYSKWLKTKLADF